MIKSRGGGWTQKVGRHKAWEMDSWEEMIGHVQGE